MVTIHWIDGLLLLWGVLDVADRNMSPLFISSDPSVSPDPEMSKAAVAEQDEGSQGSYKEIVKKFAFMGWFGTHFSLFSYHK